MRFAYYIAPYGTELPLQQGLFCHGSYAGFSRVVARMSAVHGTPAARHWRDIRERTQCGTCNPDVASRVKPGEKHYRGMRAHSGYLLRTTGGCTHCASALTCARSGRSR